MEETGGRPDSLRASLACLILGVVIFVRILFLFKRHCVGWTDRADYFEKDVPGILVAFSLAFDHFSISSDECWMNERHQHFQNKIPRSPPSFHIKFKWYVVIIDCFGCGDLHGWLLLLLLLLCGWRKNCWVGARFCQ